MYRINTAYMLTTLLIRESQLHPCSQFAHQAFQDALKINRYSTMEINLKIIKSDSLSLVIYFGIQIFPQVDMYDVNSTHDPIY